MKNRLMWMIVMGATAASALAADSFIANADDRARIEQAVPTTALVPPSKPRKLLIFTLNVGYGGHPSIAYADEAFTLMGRKTGAFETYVSNDPAVFERDMQFDAVFFNNTVGNCFTNADLRENLVEFVVGGGGLLGVHGTTVAFTQWPGAVEDWPEFGYLIGARGANHKDSDEHIWLKLDDAAHPLTRVFGGGFDYRDEFFRPQGTYSRDRVRVLLSIDTAKCDPNQGQPRGNCVRPDNDYAVAWIRSYGRGRVFYSTIAHNPYVFWDPKMLRFYLGAIQFALGDLPAPTTPSAKLTPAMRAQEQLGWRIALETTASSQPTLFQAIDSEAQAGLVYVEAASSQRVSAALPKNLGPELTDAELAVVRLKLESAGLHLLAYTVDSFPTVPADCRKLFAFGRKLGIETFIAEPRPETLPAVETLCDEFGISLALHNGDRTVTPEYWNADGVLKLCQGHGRRIGACADLEAWRRSGVNPISATRQLKDRLLVVQVPGSENSRDETRTKQLLTEVVKSRSTPIITIASPSQTPLRTVQVTHTIDTLNAISLSLTAKR